MEKKRKKFLIFYVLFEIDFRYLSFFQLKIYVIWSFFFSFSTLVYPILNHIPLRVTNQVKNKTFSCLPVILSFNTFEMLWDMTMILLYKKSLVIFLSTFAKQTKTRSFMENMRRKNINKIFNSYSKREIVYETVSNVSPINTCCIHNTI